MLKRIILLFVSCCIMLGFIACGSKTSIEINDKDSFTATEYDEKFMSETQNDEILNGDKIYEPQKYSLSQISKVRLVSEYDKDSVVDDMDSLEFGGSGRKDALREADEYFQK